MIIRVILLAIVGAASALLQSTFLADVIPWGFVPDIALIIIVAGSWRYGSLVGEIAGFFCGLALDALGLAPLGFHAFLYTAVGYLFGRLQDNVAPGPVFFPMLSVMVATVMKYSGALLLSWIFAMESPASRYLSVSTAFEIALNAALAPFIFLMIHLLGRLVDHRRGGF